jgi:hypothetical protein
MTFLLLPLLVLLALPLQAADQMVRLFGQPGSKLTIKGDNNVHVWKIDGQVIEGVFEVGTDFPMIPNETVKPGKKQARIEGSIPVRSLHGNEGMDASMYVRLKEETTPRILFRFAELILNSLPESKDAPYLFDSRIEVVAAGVTNQLSMPLRVFLLASHKLKMTGSSPAKMTDFDIQPPEIRLSDKNGTLKYRDKIELSFEWLLAPEPSARTNYHQ